MKMNQMLLGSIALLAVAPLAGCGSNDNGVGTTFIDCSLAAHNEIDGTARDDAKREFTLGEIINKCLKEKGLKPSSEKAGCLVEPSSADLGKPFVKASTDCWAK